MVQKPEKVAGCQGYRQIGKMPSSERGKLVTVAIAVNAAGNSIPAFIIFPRKQFRQHFLRDGPAGCSGDANPSGWMVKKNSWNTLLILLLMFDVLVSVLAFYY